MTALMSDDDLAELNGEVIEGDVVSSEVAVLPPDVSTKVQELAPLDGEAQARQVTTMLSASRTGLLAAIAAQDLPGIVDFKQKASAIQVISKQLQLGKDMQLDAAEFLRRAERGLGVAIRDGQERGEVLRRGERRSKSNQYSAQEVHDWSSKPSPEDFASPDELHNSRGHGIYDITDGVSDEDFEEALAEARGEGNMSRANVARKAKVKANPSSSGDADASPQPAGDKKLSPAPREASPKSPRPTGGPKGDPNQMLGNVDGMLRGLVTTLEFIRPEDINDDERKTLTDGITRSISLIRKKVKEIANG